MKDVTFAITHWKRPKDLEVCVSSIKSFFPDAKIDDQDTEGNLSYGRNRLIERCSTPYYFMMEDDMRAYRKTDLRTMRKVLDADDHLIGVGGRLKEGRGVRSVAREFIRRRGEIAMVLADRVYRSEGAIVVECAHTQNMGLYKTDRIQEYRYEERLPMAEHNLFYWSIHEAQKYRVACVDSLVKHVRSRPSDEYRAGRKRGNSKTLLRLGTEIAGARFASWVKIRDEWTAAVERSGIVLPSS